MLAFEITVPAVRGLQAGHEYYVSAVPLCYIPRVFPSCGNDSTSKVSGQPAIDKKRVRELAQYMLDNPAQYALPPIIACIDGRVNFVPVADGANANIGCVRVPMDARISVSDARHWIAAIETVLTANPDLGSETVSAVFIPDVAFKRCRQLFADLARYSVRTSASLALSYDQRGEPAQVAKAVMRSSVVC